MLHLYDPRVARHATILVQIATLPTTAAILKKSSVG